MEQLNNGHSFSKTLNKIMLVKGLTQAQLAKKSGVKKTTLNAWTSGVSPRNMIHVLAVAKVLEVDFQFLLTGIESSAIRTIETSPSMETVGKYLSQISFKLIPIY